MLDLVTDSRRFYDEKNKSIIRVLLPYLQMPWCDGIKQTTNKSSACLCFSVHLISPCGYLAVVGAAVVHACECASVVNP